LESEADIHYRDTGNNTVLHNMALAPDIWEPDKFKEIVSVLEGHDKTFANQFGEFNNNDRNPLQVASAS